MKFTLPEFATTFNVGVENQRGNYKESGKITSRREFPDKSKYKIAAKNQ